MGVEFLAIIAAAVAVGCFLGVSAANLVWYALTRTK